MIQYACLGRVSSEHVSASVVDWCPVRRGGFKMFYKNSVLVYQAEGAIFMFDIENSVRVSTKKTLHT